MTKTIQPHHDADDLSKLFIDSDLLLWTEETAIIEKEAALFAGLLSARLIELSKSRQANFNPLFDEIDAVMQTNPIFREKLTAYSLQLEGLKECEDLQCETHFLNSHNHFRVEIAQHLAHYRKLKVSIFNALALA